MVLGRNDKRKRKEGDLVDLMDPTSGTPKRAKVHAQRKFAQGVTTVFSPVPPLMKEKERPRSTMVTELITHKRPNTEDFLTFLCFRGTSILPPSLNFFNHGNKKEKSDAKSSARRSSANQNATSTPSTVSVSSNQTTKSEVNSNNNSSSTTQPSKSVGSTSVASNKKKFTNVIHKNVNVSKFKATTSTIQALKKKYKEQRLAKQRIENKFKTSVMRTRSSASRALLKPTNKLTSNKILQRIEKKSLCLRSSGSVVDKNKVMPSKSNTKLLPKTKKKIPLKKRVGERSESSSRGSFSDDNPSEISKKSVRLKTTGSMKQAARGNNVKPKNVLTTVKKKPELTRRVTRSHSDTISNTIQMNTRPSRKTKEAAAVYMEILSRKLVSPDLENDDNMSLESFPEVPNTRRDTVAKNIENDKKKRLIKKKINETINAKDKNLKSTLQKAPVKVKKCVKPSKDSESDDNQSTASGKSTNKVSNIKTRAITRRSSNLLQAQPLLNRNLRSSKSTCQKSEKSKLNTQTNVINKDKKINIKRKNDELIAKETGEVNNTVKQDGEKKEKRLRKKVNDNGESDEEPLGKVLNRIKKDKVSKPIILARRTSINKAIEINKKIESSEPVIMIKKMNKIGIDNAITKISDDEGSFRGFSKKSIKNVMNTSSTNKNDLLTIINSKETDSKLDLLKNYDKNKLEPKNESGKILDTNAMKDKASASIDKLIIPQFFQKNLTTIPSTILPSTSLAINEKMQNIIGVPSTKLIGRKERVNMSTEQIEKWLNESSMVKEESKAEMETVTNFPYGIEQEKNKLDISTSCHLSIPTRIQHLVRPVNVAIAKMADKQFNTVEMNQSMDNQMKIINNILISSTGIAVAKPINIPTNRNKINADIKEIIKGRTVKELMNLPITNKTNQEVSTAIDNHDVTLKSTDDSDTSPSSVNDKKKKSQPQQQRKTFLSKTKERKLSTPNSNAFSPENESSVYAFESETETPVSTPFRRKIRDNNKLDTPEKNEDKQSPTDSGNVTTSAANNSPKGDDKNVNLSNEGVKVKHTLVKNLTNAKILRFDNIPAGWNNLSCGNSIAVQVNFDDNQESQEINTLLRENHVSEGMDHEKNDDKNCDNNTSTEISTQTDNANDNEDDNNTQVFYIPFETVGRNISHLTTLQGQSLIQGVAVKLGTEGASGPNQRVLLRAQLVTKPPITVTRCPPVGTVQPTTRTPQNTLDSMPSTSSSTVGLSPASTNEGNDQRGVNVTRTQSLQTRSSGTETVLEKAKKTVKTVSRAKKVSTSVDSPSIKPAEKEKRRPGKKVKKTSISSSETEQSSMNQDAHSSLMSSSSIMNDKSEARLADAPTFHPSEKDFQDPLEYIEKIRPIAEKYGICKVVPPSNFKPECKVSDDMRFTAYNQYVHRMLHRWGPNVKEMMAIKKYLATQSITLSQPPWIGGMEVDLPHLYQTVQSLGGLKEVIEKKKWQKVADGMKIPKSAQDRVTKLDDIYCKYLLPYDTLSTAEREKLFEDVEKEWKKRETKALERLNDSTTSLSSLETSNNEEEDEDESSDEIEECIVKGRNMPLNAFYRIARNTQRMWFGENQRNNQNEMEGASSSEVEAAFWKHVSERKRHVCVHAASIDSSGRGFGFSVAKNSPFARHPWNLKVLTNNSGSVLRALGPLMGVTIPTIHVGMLFSACCWYRDPHGLPWIEYLHTGAKKIWYGIPNEYNDNFREALSKMVPRFCKNKTIWLPSDTAMVPPEMLVSNGVPLCRIVQEPGQFIIVFPKAFTSSICTGYVVSESVYFAQTLWLENAEQIFKDLQDSCEPSMFSFEQLLFSIINDSRSHIDILKQILPVMMKIRERELHYRQQLEYYGLLKMEKLPVPDSGKRKKALKVKDDDGDFECETCRMNLFVSLVNNSQDDSAYCLPHALQLIARKKQVLKHCTLKYTYNEDELDDLIHKLEDRIEAKSKKKQSKQSY